MTTFAQSSVIRAVTTNNGRIFDASSRQKLESGILIPLWIGECDQGEKGFESASFTELSDCARGSDLGKINAQVKVDNVPVATLDAVESLQT